MKAVIILLVIDLILGVWAAALWLLPIGVSIHIGPEAPQTAKTDQPQGDTASTATKAMLPMQEASQKKEIVNDEAPSASRRNAHASDISELSESSDYSDHSHRSSAGHSQLPAKSLPKANLRHMASSSPFYKEAQKILQGKLEESDAKCRKMILNYCEHFRTAYTTKDIDFLRQVFSDQALIIVGNVVRPKTGADNTVSADPTISYAIHSKHAYLQRLSRVFAANEKIDVRFSDFRILRHPTMSGIYGVSLRQQYKSDRYQDDGYLFLLWDFRNKSNPTIHVRTWQAADIISKRNEVISLQDFVLE